MDAKYRAANLERMKARDAAYYAENREKIKASHAAYRAAKKAKAEETKAQWIQKKTQKTQNLWNLIVPIAQCAGSHAQKEITLNAHELHNWSTNRNGQKKPINAFEDYYMTETVPIYIKGTDKVLQAEALSLEILWWL